MLWRHSGLQIDCSALHTSNVSFMVYTLQGHTRLQTHSIGKPTLNVSILFLYKQRSTTETFLETLNDRLPLKHTSHRPQTLAKHVSDDPRHLIFRLPEKQISDLFPDLFLFLRFFILFWRATHFWTSRASSPWKTAPYRPIISPARPNKWSEKAFLAVRATVRANIFEGFFCEAPFPGRFKGKSIRRQSDGDPQTRCKWKGP